MRLVVASASVNLMGCWSGSRLSAALWLGCCAGGSLLLGSRFAGARVD